MNFVVTINGKQMTLEKAAKKYNINQGTLFRRWRRGLRGKELIKPTHCLATSCTMHVDETRVLPDGREVYVCTPRATKFKIQGKTATAVLQGNHVLMIDACDVPLLEGYHWGLWKGIGVVTVVNDAETGKRVQLSLHRLVVDARMKPVMNVVVMHANKNPLDNRFDNLKVAPREKLTVKTIAKLNKKMESRQMLRPVAAVKTLAHKCKQSGVTCTTKYEYYRGNIAKCRLADGTTVTMDSADAHVMAKGNCQLVMKNGDVYVNFGKGNVRKLANALLNVTTQVMYLNGDELDLRRANMVTRFGTRAVYGTGYVLVGADYDETKKRWCVAGNEYTSMMPALKAALRGDDTPSQKKKAVNKKSTTTAKKKSTTCAKKGRKK